MELGWDSLILRLASLPAHRRLRCRWWCSWFFFVANHFQRHFWFGFLQPALFFTSATWMPKTPPFLSNLHHMPWKEMSRLVGVLLSNSPSSCPVLITRALTASAWRQYYVPKNCLTEDNEGLHFLEGYSVQKWRNRDLTEDLLSRPLLPNQHQRSKVRNRQWHGSSLNI